MNIWRFSLSNDDLDERGLKKRTIEMTMKIKIFLNCVTSLLIFSFFFVRLDDIIVLSENFVTLKNRNQHQHTVTKEGLYVINIQKMASAPFGPPGGLAVPDDQGNLGFCSRFALGKAIGNGFMVRKFDPHQQLDFVQRDIATAIVNADEGEDCGAVGECNS